MHARTHKDIHTHTDIHIHYHLATSHTWHFMLMTSLLPINSVLSLFSLYRVEETTSQRGLHSHMASVLRLGLDPTGEL